MLILKLCSQLYMTVEQTVEIFQNAEKNLVHSLRAQLNHRLKKKKRERHFVMTRLRLVNRRFYRDRIHFLHQTYVDHASLHQIFSVSDNQYMHYIDHCSIVDRITSLR
jgi:hypothetical protein